MKIKIYPRTGEDFIGNGETLFCMPLLRSYVYDNGIREVYRCIVLRCVGMDLSIYARIGLTEHLHWKVREEYTAAFNLADESIITLA